MTTSRKRTRGLEAEKAMKISLDVMQLYNMIWEDIKARVNGSGRKTNET